MKRWTALVLVVCLLLGMGTARAENPIVKYLKYEINEDNTITITGYSINDWGGGFESVEIPSTIDGRTVTRIDDNAFFMKSLAEVVYIPATVTSIGNQAMTTILTSAVVFLGDAPEVVPVSAANPMGSFWSYTKLYYLPGTEGWTTPTWNGYSCVPLEIDCEHMDAQGVHLVGERPADWDKENYPYSWDEYEQLDSDYHKVNTHWNFVCSNCHQEVTLVSDWQEKHVFEGEDKCKLCGLYCRHNSLETLTDVDYLAFSSLAYEDMRGSITVREFLADVWDTPWEGTDILYRDLFSYVQDWWYLDFEENTDTGFYAIAFANDNNNDVVIAYRGSIPLGNDEMKDWTGEEWDDMWNDWLWNDIIPIALDYPTSSEQFDDALAFYLSFEPGRNKENIVVTGHSLGGGLANSISACSGCKGYAFDGVSILDTNYFFHPYLMSIRFSGIDDWNYVDHVNRFDALAGMWQVTQKNAYIHESMRAYTEGILDFANHPMHPMVYKDDFDNIKMTDFVESPATEKVRYLGADDREDAFWQVFEGALQKIGDDRILELGTSKSDIFVPVKGVKTVSYGGTGIDQITTSTEDDVIIGGPGNDYLDGGTWGDDLYIYNKGDGLDYIVDTVGNDEIYLQGFDENDEIRVLPAYDTQYSYFTEDLGGRKVLVTSETKQGAVYSVIMCNGEPIIYLDKNRANNSSNALTLNIGGKKQDITEEIQPKIVTIVAHYEFSCPIDIDILDADGNVVYTVKDSQLGNFYNDYGNFYVLPNEDSPYNSKIIDLFEGYSIKIRGIGEGKMSLLVQDTDNYELLDACGANEVSITSDTTGTIEEDEETGIKYLLLDSDGDGDIDETIPLNPVHFEVEDHDSPMEYVPAQNATCVEDGVAAHYLCSCGRIFKDAEAKEEITDAAELVLPATGQHNYVKGKCTVCGQAQPRVPQTGDNTPLYAFCAMSMVTAAVLVVTLRRKKKA